MQNCAITFTQFLPFFKCLWKIFESRVPNPIFLTSLVFFYCTVLYSALIFRKTYVVWWQNCRYCNDMLHNYQIQSCSYWRLISCQKPHSHICKSLIFFSCPCPSYPSFCVSYTSPLSLFIGVILEHHCDVWISAILEFLSQRGRPFFISAATWLKKIPNFPRPAPRCHTVSGCWCRFFSRLPCWNSAQLS